MLPHTAQMAAAGSLQWLTGGHLSPYAEIYLIFAVAMSATLDAGPIATFLGGPWIGRLPEAQGRGRPPGRRRMPHMEEDDERDSDQRGQPHRAQRDLAQHEAVTALMVARQFESFNRMSTFVVHDLKNLVSQLSLLLSNAEKHKKNPEFQKDMIETVYLSVQKMKRLLEKLSSGDSPEKAAPLIIARLLQEAVKSKSIAEPRPILEIQDSSLSVYANSSRLERVVGHLIQNAIEATSRNGNSARTARL